MRAYSLQEDLKRAEYRVTHSDKLLILKTQELDRLLQRRESLTSTYIDTCRRRYSGMSMRRLQNSLNFPEVRVRVLTNFHSFQELSFFYHSVINHDIACTQCTGSPSGCRRRAQREKKTQRCHFQGGLFLVLGHVTQARHFRKCSCCMVRLVCELRISCGEEGVAISAGLSRKDSMGCS